MSRILTALTTCFLVHLGSQSALAQMIFFEATIDYKYWDTDICMETTGMGLAFNRADAVSQAKEATNAPPLTPCCEDEEDCSCEDEEDCNCFHNLKVVIRVIGGQNCGRFKARINVHFCDGGFAIASAYGDTRIAARRNLLKLVRAAGEGHGGIKCRNVVSYSRVCRN